MPLSGAGLGAIAPSRPKADHRGSSALCAARAERLASQIDRACAESESAMQASLAARDDQQLAWLILCDRGWCAHHRRAPDDMQLVRRWLATWADYVALPVWVQAPQDQVRCRLLRRALTRLEVGLRAAIPPSVWNIVDPLDATGRATLACALLALDRWVEMSAHAAAIERTKARQMSFLSLLAELARSLGLAAPSAPFDLNGWRGLATQARALAALARQETAA